MDDVSDHQFFGIASSEADYKISLRLNQIFNLKLKSGGAIEKTGEETTRFQRFVHRSELNEDYMQLVCNKTEGSVFSSFYPSLDYLYLLCGELNSDADQIKEKILTIPEVTAVFLLDNKKMIEEYLLLQIL
ncbi:MAG: hypothetical protein QNK33_04995 [Bacteroidales bacterium]|nr:hypothetical protein [Bacteroidales bacterium]